MMTERYNFFVLLSLQPNNQPISRSLPKTRLFIADGSDKELDSCALSPTINDHFAFHPIVDPLSRRIIAFEAIVQKNEDSPSAIAVGQRKDGEIYTADLKSKALAFAMAHALELGDKMISINLLPMTLVNEPDAVSFYLMK